MLRFKFLLLSWRCRHLLPLPGATSSDLLSLLQIVDQATYGQLLLDAQGGTDASLGSPPAGTPGRRLLASSEGGATVLPASAVGSWANCSAECTYEGLATGYYSLRVKAVDAAGNAGNATAPYPFQVGGSRGRVCGKPARAGSAGSWRMCRSCKWRCPEPAC